MRRATSAPGNGPALLELLGENAFDQGFGICMAWLTVEVAIILGDLLITGVTMLIAKTGKPFWIRVAEHLPVAGQVLVAERLPIEERVQMAERLPIEELEAILERKRQKANAGKPPQDRENG